MAIEDLTPWFESLKNPSDDIDADTIINNITSVYQGDLEIRDTAVKAKETELTAAQQKIQDLQVKNYELLMKQPAGNVPGNGDNNNPSGDDDRAATVTFADILNKGDK